MLCRRQRKYRQAGAFPNRRSLLTNVSESHNWHTALSCSTLIFESWLRHMRVIHNMPVMPVVVTGYLFPRSPIIWQKYFPFWKPSYQIIHPVKLRNNVVRVIYFCPNPNTIIINFSYETILKLCKNDAYIHSKALRSFILH